MANGQDIHADGRTFEIGRTIANAFGLIRTHPVRVLGLSFLLAGIPLRALSVLLPTHADDPIFTSARSLGVLFVELVLQTILAGLYPTDIAGQEAGIGAGARRLPKLIAAALLKAIGSTIGFACLLIPYLFLVVRWSVVGPVLANEGRGIGASFTRSTELTEGVRLRIFGLLLLSVVGQMIFSSVALLLVSPLTGRAVIMQDFSTNPIALTARLVVQTCMMGFGAVLQCALYAALRERREGPRADDLREIFA